MARITIDRHQTSFLLNSEARTHAVRVSREVKQQQRQQGIVYSMQKQLQAKPSSSKGVKQALLEEGPKNDCVKKCRWGYTNPPGTQWVFFN